MGDTTMRARILAAAALLTLAGTTARSQEAPTAPGTVRLVVRPESKLWLEGTSNLHAWSCKATALDAAIDVDSSYTTTEVARGDIAGAAKLVKRVETKVPVRSLKCGHDGMDKNLYKALKASDASQVHYILGTFNVVPGGTKDSVTVEVAGTLTVAEVERPITMTVTAERLDDGAVRARAAVPILMTDFGIKPPTALLGTLRTGNKVFVKFELLVGPQTTVAAAGDPAQR
jgi:hypothetical protein